MTLTIGYMLMNSLFTWSIATHCADHEKDDGDGDGDATAGESDTDYESARGGAVE